MARGPRAHGRGGRRRPGGGDDGGGQRGRARRSPCGRPTPAGRPPSSARRCRPTSSASTWWRCRPSARPTSAEGPCCSAWPRSAPGPPWGSRSAGASAEAAAGPGHAACWRAPAGPSCSSRRSSAEAARRTATAARRGARRDTRGAWGGTGHTGRTLPVAPFLRRRSSRDHDRPAAGPRPPAPQERPEPLELAPAAAAARDALPAAVQPPDAELFDLPFFYWYQLAVVAVGVGVDVRRVPRDPQRDAPGHAPDPSPHRAGALTWATSRPPSWSSSPSCSSAVSLLGFFASRWRAAKDLENLDEWGLGGRNFGAWITWFLIGGDLYTAYTFVAVPGPGVRRRRGRLLRPPVHDRRLPGRVLRAGQALVGQPRQRLRHPGRLRPRPLRLADPGAARRPHRHRRDDALHRAAAGRHRGGAQGHGRDRRDPDHRGLRDPGGLHLQLRPARPGADRLRQGHPDLRRRHRGRHRHPGEARRLGRDLRRRRRPSSTPPRTRATASCSAAPASCSTRRSPSARRWRCSSTRTRSPACSPRRAGTRSRRTWRPCRPTASCSACSPCSATWPSPPA